MTSSQAISPASVIALLLDAAAVVERGLEKRLFSVGLSVPQYRLLFAVASAKEPLTPTLLSALLLQETHSTSGLLNRLDDRGLIAREHDKLDRRVVWVSLTEDGRAVVRKATELAADEIRAVASAVAPSRRDEVLLSRILETGIQRTGTDRSKRDEALGRTGSDKVLALA